MKKNYLLIAGFLLFGLAAKSQILNQSAAWPNAAWTVTGSYNTDPTAFEASPLTTANFAFDDDDAGGSHEDNIAAESPIINLTPAFNGGEKNIFVTVDYGYRYLANDQLRLEYWNAATSAWVAWGANIPGNSTSASDNYCTTITKTTYTSTTLDISNFTTAQLSGFRYRISYDDDPAGTDWNYGFCFASPTIKSLSCAIPSGLTISGLSSGGATISWTSVGGATAYQYAIDTNSANPTSGSDLNATSYMASGLNAQTQYYFHIRTSCTGSTSDWTTISFYTSPANDNCAGAVALAVNADLACGVTTPGTLRSATDSGIASTTGNADDDVWYKFVATATSQVVTLTGIAGTPTDLVHQVFSGDCAVLTSILASDPNTSTVSGLTVGNTYYVRVFTYANGGNPTTTFNICVGTLPPPPANDECSAAISLTVNPTTTCTTSTPGTLVGATNSGVASTTGAADDDVWYKFVATGTTHFIALTNIAGSPIDLVHQVFSGDCAVLTSVLSSDPESSTVTGLTVGTTYYVRVYTYANGVIPTTTFNICVTSLPPAPANDNCSGAVTLTVNADLSCAVKTSSSLAGSTNSGIAATTGTADDDVWFKFVATNAIQPISLTSITGSPTDLVHQVFSGDCAVLTSIMSSDPETSTVTGLTVGNTYYVRVYSYTSGSVSTTNFDICVGTPPAPPANDDCANAISLNVDANFCTGSNTNGTNVSATDSGVANASCFNYGKKDVWFKFMVPAGTASVNVSTDFTGGTLVDSEIALYAGICGQLSAIACDQDSGTTVLSNGSSYNSLITDADVNVGETYFVRVSGYSASAVGTFCLEISTNEELSTGDLSKNSLKAYPNPVKDILTLENASEISEVHVFNILGQEVIAKKVDASSAQINMSALAKGTYVVKVMANDAVRTIKVIKE